MKIKIAYLVLFVFLLAGTAACTRAPKQAWTPRNSVKNKTKKRPYKKKQRKKLTPEKMWGK